MGRDFRDVDIDVTVKAVAAPVALAQRPSDPESGGHGTASSTR
jgi:hypothetical protein